LICPHQLKISLTQGCLQDRFDGLSRNQPLWQNMAENPRNAKFLAADLTL